MFEDTDALKVAMACFGFQLMIASSSGRKTTQRSKLGVVRGWSGRSG